MSPDILQSLNVRVNNYELALTATPGGHDDTLYQGNIPRAWLGNDLTQFTFQVASTMTPQATSGPSDARSLGMAFDWMQLDCW